jgi:cytochrome bd-type quinol oxidase subunit 2
MYVVESAFWLRFILLLAIVSILMFSFHTIMRKWLKVEKKKSFSYNHVNATHKKVDWAIRITAIVIIFVGYIITILRGSIDMIWFIQPWFILFIFIGVSETVRAVMERRYAENPNDYKLTISQIIFMFVLFFILYMTDFFGLI